MKQLLIDCVNLLFSQIALLLLSFFNLMKSYKIKFMTDVIWWSFKAITKQVGKKVWNRFKVFSICERHSPEKEVNKAIKVTGCS